MFTLTTKTIRILCTVAGILLLVIGAFHGSGLNYIDGLIQNSDVPQLIKNIFPVLFIIPSFQLIGLGVIGFFAIQKSMNYHILFTLSLLVLIDAILAFWLNAFIPGLILLAPSSIYLIAGYSSKKIGS